MPLPDTSPQPAIPNLGEPAPVTSDSNPFAQLPTETEIYILPTGEIVIADMPVELAARLAPDVSQSQNPRPTS